MHLKIQMQNAPAVAEHHSAVNMTYTVLDPTDFTEKGIFSEDSFLHAVESFDFSTYSGKKVLVRGCSSAIIPPWAFMKLTAELVPHAKSIRFGNEHDNILLYKEKK